MATIVILSMHGSGSSLVASICDALGVNMNPNPNAKVRWYLNYEDADFVRLNSSILRKCGGNWKKPPSIERVLGYRDNGFFDDRIKGLVSQRSGLWGFKDPRTSITIPIIHPHLSEPKYIRVVRGYNAIAKSLMSRGGGSINRDRWIALARQHNESITTFLDSVDSERLSIRFDDLLNRKKTKEVVNLIADFVGCGNVDKAIKRVKYDRK